LPVDLQSPLWHQRNWQTFSSPEMGIQMP